MLYDGFWGYFWAKNISLLNISQTDSGPGSSQLKSFNDLVESVQSLKDQLSCAMDVSWKTQPQSSAQKLKDQLFSTIASSVEELKSSPSDHAVAVSQPDKMNSHVTSIDRRNNVIIFGLGEESLMDTKKDIKSILEFLYGRLMPFNDAFRLSQFKGHDSDHPPSPLPVKLSNVWDNTCCKTQFERF